MEKNDLVGDALKIMPPEYVPLLYQGKLLRNDTSGSTGKCLEVYWKREDYMRSMFSLWFYRKKFYGIQPWHKRCRFYTMAEPGEKEPLSRVEENALTFSKNNLTEQRMVEIYCEMLEFEPVWMILQPSVAELLCMVKAQYELPEISSLRYIEMTGEELTDKLRERLRDAFHCQVANQYGANEVNSIAYECPKGHLHCMEDNVKVEILDDEGNVVEDGTTGNIYVTTLHNHAMPFDHYGIGDVGRLEKNTCDCGHKGKILHLESGRKAIWVQLEDGSRITPYVFVRAIDCLNVQYDNCIWQFQIIQEDFDRFTIHLVVDEKIPELCEKFVQYIGDERLKKASYEFVFSKGLFPDLTGKRSYFKPMERRG